VGCAVASIHYGLAPEHPYPAGLEDCLAAYRWLLDNAAVLEIDSGRLALAGDSAGGCLAAGLARLVRDRCLPPPLFQMLVYPVTDAALETDSMRRFTDTPIWNAPLNKAMWELYLGGRRDDAAVRAAASPLRGDLAGLPEAYVEVAEFDCLRDEGVAYHRRLLECGVPSVLRETRGTIHGFEANYHSAHTRFIFAERIAFIRDRFHGRLRA
jgi:acetyl esterase/lipase